MNPADHPPDINIPNNNNPDNNILNNIPNVQNNINFSNLNNNNTHRYKKTSLSFIIILSIRLIVLLFDLYKDIDISKYCFQLYPILTKHQYYRMLTRYFIAFSSFHLFLEMLCLYYLCSLLENYISSIITVAFIAISLLIISIINFLILYLVNEVSHISDSFRVYDYDFIYEGGMTPLIFCMYTFYTLFSANKSAMVNIIIFIQLKMKNLPWIALVCLHFLTPNQSFLGNFSGIFAAKIFYKFGRVLLPNTISLLQFEDEYNLNKVNALGNVYRFINVENKNLIKNIREINYSKGFEEYQIELQERSQQMVELAESQERNQ